WAPPPSWGVSVRLVLWPRARGRGGWGPGLRGDLKQRPDGLTPPPVPSEELPEALAVLGHAPVAWLQFLGHPTMALLVPTGLAFWLLGLRRGLSADRLAQGAGGSLTAGGGILVLFRA